MSRAFNRRDASEKHRVKIFEDAGGKWHPLQREDGADGLLLCNFDLRIVEIKNTPRDLLTDAEQDLREKCLLAGVPYEVVDSDDAARVLIADMRGERVIDPLPFSDYRVSELTHVIKD